MTRAPRAHWVRADACTDKVTAGTAATCAEAAEFGVDRATLSVERYTRPAASAPGDGEGLLESELPGVERLSDDGPLDAERHQAP